MSLAVLEHANLKVADIDRTIRFLTTALPGWAVRGEGRIDWYGKPVRWLHLGTAQQYLALQDGGEGALPAWQGAEVGVKHLGFVVDDLDAVVERLARAGHVMDHPGGTHPARRSAYYCADDLVQVEFVQYLSDDPARRNDYRE